MSLDQFFHDLFGGHRHHEHRRIAAMCFFHHHHGVLAMNETTQASEIVIGDGNIYTVAIAFFDANGKATSAPTFTSSTAEAPTWSVADPSIGTVTPSEDGLSCSIDAAAPGTLSPTFSATDDNGVVYNITGTIPVVAESTSPGPAATAQMVFSVTTPAPATGTDAASSTADPSAPATVTA